MYGHVRQAILHNTPFAGASLTEDRTTLLVLGLGNALLRDDGAGVAVIRRLQEGKGVPAGTRLLDGGTLSFSLLEEIENCDALIVVDAAQMDEPAGTVRVFRDAAMDAFLRGKRACSVHEISLLELLDMARLTELLPGKRAFIGIQPERIDWGTEVSPSVAESLDIASMHARALMARFSI